MVVTVAPAASVAPQAQVEMVATEGMEPVVTVRQVGWEMEEPVVQPGPEEQAEMAATVATVAMAAQDVR